MTKKIVLCGCLSLLVLCSISGCLIGSQENSEFEKIDPIPLEETIPQLDIKAAVTESKKIIEVTEFSSKQIQSETPRQSTSSTETSAIADDPESNGKTILWEAPNGELFYKEDAVSDGSLLTFDQAVYRPSTGVFYDSLTNPELFDPETHEFLGDLIEYDESDWCCVHTGDTINGYTVECAKISFNIDDEAYFKANTITFQEDVILTGYLMYCSYDEPTTITTGDFIMIPDESFQGMPRVNIYPLSAVVSGQSWENPDEFVLPAYYTDAPMIPLGNLYRDYAENEELKALIGDGTESKKIRAEVTISHLDLCFADMMGDSWTSGKIVGVKEIQ